MEPLFMVHIEFVSPGRWAFGLRYAACKTGVLYENGNACDVCDFLHSWGISAQVFRVVMYGGFWEVAP